MKVGMGRTRSEPSVRFRPPGRRDILELGSLRAGSDERRRKTTATVAVTMLMMMLEVPDTAAPLRRVVRRVSDVGVIDNRCAASTLPSLALCIPDGGGVVDRLLSEPRISTPTLPPLLPPSLFATAPSSCTVPTGALGFAGRLD